MRRFHESNTPPGAALLRRSFLQQSGIGLGSLALASLLKGSGQAEVGAHRAAKAKRVIYMFMHGGYMHMVARVHLQTLARR